MTLYIPLEPCIEVKEEKEYALNEMSSLMSFFSWTYQKKKENYSLSAMDINFLEYNYGHRSQ